MDLKEYQPLAEATAMAEARAYQYLIPGILGEVGELFGQQAKAYWHHWAPEQLEEQLVKEYGDVAWMTAMLLHGEGTFQVEVPASWQPGWGGMKPDPHALLLSAAAQVHSAWLNIEEYYYMDEAAERLWAVLLTQCEAITGRTFDHVLQVNLDKLASRAARGVLVGSGDNR